MSNCCDGFVGGLYSLTVEVPGLGNYKFTLEGDLSVKKNTFTNSGRDQGLGGRKERNNSYIEGTAVLFRGDSNTFGDLNDTGLTTFSSNNFPFCDIQGQCNMVIKIESDCGEIWVMTGAFDASDQIINVYEGTVSFRFESPRPVTYQTYDQNSFVGTGNNNFPVI